MLGAVTAPSSVISDLFLRASAHFGVVQEFFILCSYLGHKVLELPVLQTASANTVHGLHGDAYYVLHFQSNTGVSVR